MDDATPGSTPQHVAVRWAKFNAVHQVCDEQLAAARCLYADTFDGRCALAATADSPPPERVQMAELVRDNERLRQQCDKWRGIADALAASITDHRWCTSCRHCGPSPAMRVALARWREAQ